MSDFKYSSDDSFSSNYGGSSGNEADSEGEEAYGKEMNQTLDDRYDENIQPLLVRA